MESFPGSIPEGTENIIFLFLFSFYILAFKKANNSKGSKQFSKLKLSYKIQNFLRSSILLRATAKNLLEVA